MSGELICINRQWYQGAIKEASCPEELKPAYREAIDKYAAELREHWSKMMGPRTYENRYKAVHACHACRDVPGTPWTEEDEREYRKGRDTMHASWAPALYAERVMKMGGKWGDDDRIEHDPRTAKIYRLLDEAADYVDRHGDL